MIGSVFNFTDLPKFHEDKLLLKSAASVRTGALGGRFLQSQQPQKLASLLKKGLVVSVIPLTVGVVEEQPMAMAVGTGMTTQFAEEVEESEVSLVEIKSGASVDSITKELKGDKDIEYVEPVPIRYLCVHGPAATPPDRSGLWNLKKIRWQESIELGIKQADEINVGVLDTGVQESHPDLKGRVVTYDYQRSAGKEVSEEDFSGHGTHVAGVIGAVTNGRVGITGICECNLRVWKIFSDRTWFMPRQNMFGYVVDPLAYLRALRICTRESIDVLNLSIGGPGKPSHVESEAFATMLERNTTIVAAMGNERAFGNPTSYPAAVPGVIAVGATNVNDKVTSFSSFGEHISLCAPGQAIWSTLPTYPGQLGFYPKYVRGQRTPDTKKPIPREVDYDAWNGTSMATPHVAGAVALLLANRGKDSPKRVKELLEESADRVPDMAKKGNDENYGAGRLNLLKLLTAGKI